MWLTFMALDIFYILVGTVVMCVLCVSKKTEKQICQEMGSMSHTAGSE